MGREIHTFWSYDTQFCGHYIQVRTRILWLCGYVVMYIIFKLCELPLISMEIDPLIQLKGVTSFDQFPNRFSSMILFPTSAIQLNNRVFIDTINVIIWMKQFYSNKYLTQFQNPITEVSKNTSTNRHRFLATYWAEDIPKVCQQLSVKRMKVLLRLI